MKTIFKVLGCACVALGLGGVSQAKEWRGIVPLRSSRADVVRLHGQCANPEESCHFYSAGDGEVYIVFSSRDEYVEDCVKQLPLGVVMNIRVTPMTEVRLSDLGVDVKGFRKFETSSPPGLGYEGYLDDEEGVVYDTYKGKKVIQIEYIAARKDRQLCPAYYQKPESFVLSKLADPPSVYAQCPEAVEAGGRVALTANISGGDPQVTFTFKWEVSAGKIVSGQGTSQIIVEAQQSNARAIEATVEVGGYYLSLTGSCEIQVVKKGEGGKRRPQQVSAPRPTTARTRPHLKSRRGGWLTGLSLRPSRSLSADAGG
jgi:hypothetical protein